MIPHTSANAHPILSTRLRFAYNNPFRPFLTIFFLRSSRIQPGEPTKMASLAERVDVSHPAIKPSPHLVEEEMAVRECFPRVSGVEVLSREGEDVAVALGCVAEDLMDELGWQRVDGGFRRIGVFFGLR